MSARWRLIERRHLGLPSVRTGASRILANMATYVLIPGADGRSWYWHLVAPLLQERGHEVVAVDLPVTDPAAGLEAYAAAITTAVGNRRTDLILVAQSLAGFTAPLVAERLPVR